MSFQGFLAVGPNGGACDQEIINNCRTLGYIENLKKRTSLSQAEPDYTFPDPHWIQNWNGLPDCTECCSTCFAPQDEDNIPCPITYPADPLNPAPWYDANNPEVSGGFFGFLAFETEINKGYSSRANRSTILKRVLNLNKRSVKMTGYVISNSCASTEFGLEWLTMSLSKDALCPGQNCKGVTALMHKQSCECNDVNPRLNGWRIARGVGGFEVDQIKNSEGCIPCCEGALVEITFEIERPRLWMPVAEHFNFTLDESDVANPCDCNVDQYYDDCCTATSEISTTRNRVTRLVRAQKDGNLCPVEWDGTDYNSATDRLVLESTETVPAILETTGAIVYLAQDPATGIITAHDPVTDDLFDITAVDCGDTIDVVDVRYTNEGYDPTCIECPGAQQACADTNNIEINGAGLIDFALSGLSISTWYEYPDGGPVPAALVDYLAYLNCVQVEHNAPAMAAVPAGSLQLALDEAISYFNASGLLGAPPDRLWIRLNIGNALDIRASRSTTPGEAINTSFQTQIFEYPGFNQPLLAEGTDNCGATTSVPDFCKETLVGRPDSSKPLATIVTIDPVTSVATFDSNLPVGILFSDYVGTYSVTNPNCDGCVEPVGELNIIPSASPDGTFSWAPDGWTQEKYAAFPPSAGEIVMRNQPSTYSAMAEVCDESSDCGGSNPCGPAAVPEIDLSQFDDECAECEPLNVKRYFRLIPGKDSRLGSAPIVNITSTGGGPLPWIQVVAFRDQPHRTAYGQTPDVCWATDWRSGGYEVLATVEDEQAHISVDCMSDELTVACRLNGGRHIERYSPTGCCPVITDLGWWIGIFVECGVYPELTVSINSSEFELH